jgi:hypothetical protein
MNHQFTLEDIANYFWTHRGRKSFISFTYEQVAITVLKAARDGELKYVTNNNEIIGATIFQYDHKAKIIHCKQLAADSLGFKTLLRTGLEGHEDYTITGLRLGKLKVFDKRILCLISGAKTHYQV